MGRRLSRMANTVLITSIPGHHHPRPDHDFRLKGGQVILMKSVIRLLTVLLAAPFAPAAIGASPAHRPNIVILYADDMGYGDLAIQNPQSKIPTPNLDALAREGLRCTDAHSSSGICTPSRYALLHGRYHWRKFHGIVNSFDQPVMDADRATLASMLKSKGYRTACIGKWHLGWDWNAIKKPGAQPTKDRGFAPEDFDWSKPIPGGPLSHGFDYYFGDDVPNFPPYAWFENDRVITPPTVPLGTVAMPAEGIWEARPGPSVKDWDFTAVMPTLTAKAVKWIGQQKKSEPFFLYFPFTSPHAPIVPAREFVGRSRADGYGDYVVQTDDTIGRVLKALKDNDLADDTLVIFSADNGPEGYAYPRLRKYDHRSMGPLRGLKRDVWEGGHREPFLVRWPGVVEPGRVSDALVSQVDLFATIAAIVGYTIPAGSAEDSLNQLGLFRGESGGVRDTIVHNTNPRVYAIRRGDWLLIAGKSGGGTKVPPWFDEANGYKPNTEPGELYNLRNDLGEKNNLYAQEPAKVAELMKRLADIRGVKQGEPKP